MIIREFRIFMLTFIESQSQTLPPCLQFPIAITNRIPHPYPNQNIHYPYFTIYNPAPILIGPNPSLPADNDSDTSCRFSCRFKNTSPNRQPATSCRLPIRKTFIIVSRVQIVIYALGTKTNQALALFQECW